MTGYQYGNTVFTSVVEGEPDRFRARSSRGAEVVIERPEGASDRDAHREAARTLIHGNRRHGEVFRLGGPYFDPDEPGEHYSFRPQ